MYETRNIPPGQLPKVREMDGSERDATEQELMNLGMFRAEGNLFHCIGVFADGRGQRKQPLPGEQLSRGKNRVQKTPKSVRNKFQSMKFAGE